jgi:hypothetical protein
MDNRTRTHRENHNPTFDSSKPKCALCGINLTTDDHGHRVVHEQGFRHRDNIAAVLVAMRGLNHFAAALAVLVRRR